MSNLNTKKKLINDPANVVEEMLDGIVTADASLRRVGTHPVLVRHDCQDVCNEKVALISGGGSGHEPAHAGFVGRGMLSGAACGNVFASPSKEQVLAALRAVTGSQGTLVIVKNYTGDRIAFGMAIEQARAAGLNAEMVIVGDDAALRGEGIAGRRGVAGTCFVHKIAGALAESGASLADVAAVARRVAGSVASIGVALNGCTHPGQPADTRIAEGQMEMGLGIHGEPGAATGPLLGADAVVDDMLGRVQASGYLTLSSGDRVALIVNNYGGTTPMEMWVVARRAVNNLLERGVVVERVFVGALMTSMDMAGCSLSLLRLGGAGEGDDLLALLDAPTLAPAWPNATAVPQRQPLPPVQVQGELTKTFSSPVELSPEGARLKAAIGAAATAMVAAKEQLNQWDSAVGDGDCGNSMGGGAEAILRDLEACYPLNSPTETVEAIAMTVRSSMGGTSGALYDIFFSAAAASLQAAGGGEGVDRDPRALAEAFAVGIDKIKFYSGAEAGMRTMLDAMMPAAASLRSSLLIGQAADATTNQQQQSPVEALRIAAAAAEAGAEGTKTMSALAGRSSYVPEEKLAGVPDPGAMAFAIWLRAAADAL